MNLTDKIKEAERTLKVAAEMSDYYYHAPLIICYSGGKDSDVLLNIAKNCLPVTAFEVLNSHTTVDAPETVYHIRKVFKECEAQGIKATVKLPRDKNGHLISMWSLIEKHHTPPTRIIRYCCRELKETTTPNRMVALGVREDESASREGRDSFSVRAPRMSEAEHRSTGHAFAMFRLDQYGGEDAYQCELIKACKENKDTIVNPIYKFTDDEVWQYLREFGIETNPLYSKGYKRVGCVGCPLGGYKSMKKGLADYPKYKDNYIRAFDRMIKSRRQKGMKCNFNNGKEVLRWWVGDDPKQVTFDDLLEEVTTDDK